jgi:hypothetical protein
MCCSRKAWRSVRSGVLVGMAAVLILLQPFLCQLAMAARGPCYQLPGCGGGTTGSWECQNGACVGIQVTIPPTTVCKSWNETSCTDGSVPTILTSGSASDLGWGQWAKCVLLPSVSAGVLCGAAGAVLGGGVPGALIGGALCGVVTGIGTLLYNDCCWHVCVSGSQAIGSYYQNCGPDNWDGS